MDISRRSVLHIAASLGLSAKLFPIFEAAAGTTTQTRVRQNIKTFAMDPQKVAALRAGVKRMKQLSAANVHDPFGWKYWAAVHGSNVAVTPQDPMTPGGKRIYRQCKHTSRGQFAPHFISWHRPFIYFFEINLKKAAKDAEHTTEFELPYWNWYVDKVIPKLFTDGNEESNPLWHAREFTDLSQFNALDRSAFQKSNLLPGPGVSVFDTFSLLFESDPHNPVHDHIGLDMGDTRTAARDPIFWLHHANVDRLWTAWMKGGTRVLPAADSNWSKETWTFDTQGQLTKSAGPMLDSETSLGYRYDDESMPSVVPVVVSAMQATPQRIEAKPLAAEVGEAAAPLAKGAPAPATISTTTGPITLGNEAVAVDLNVTPAVGSQLQTFAASPAVSPIKSGSIVLEDVEIGSDGKAGGFNFKIVASLPEGAAATQRRVVLGSLGTFSLSAAAPGGEDHEHVGEIGKQTLAFPLAAVVEAFGPVDAETLKKGLRITLEPTQPPKPGAQPSYVKIGAIKLIVSNLPNE